MGPLLASPKGDSKTRFLYIGLIGYPYFVAVFGVAAWLAPGLIIHGAPAGPVSLTLGE